jgi:hypothetical protein
VKRNAKQNGSGGRLRLGLLMATAAAFLLVPAASALADVPAEMVGAGEGSGWFKGAVGIEGGEPHVECHWNGATQEFDTALPPGSGECKTTAKNLGIGQGGILVEAESDPGSELTALEVDEMGGLVVPTIGCSAPALGDPEACGALTFVPGTLIKMTATFDLEPLPEFPLSVTKSAEGSVECKVSGSSVPCTGGEVEETKPVELIATPNVGYEPEWTTGPCAGSHSNTCSFTMPGSAVSANADFGVAQETLTVTESGPGSVACEVNSTPAPCNGTYNYGDSVKVVATPSGAPGENKVGNVTTGGSASCVNVETSATCEFTLTSNSSVAVLFEAAGTKDEFDGNVHGEVKPETTLETGGCDDVDLGIFAPGVAATYPGICEVTSTSTGGVTELSAEDGGANPGHLENTEPGPTSPYYLEDPLQVRAGAGSLAPLTSTVSLLTYEAPVYKDTKTVEFSQDINAGEALRTGVYAKTITLTLEQTTP